MKEPERFSFRKRGKSFSHAWKGIIYLMKTEHNARVHLAAMIIAAALGVSLRIEPQEWIAIAIVSGMVVITELLNSAIEKLADMVEPEWNKQIGIIKDYSAGAVLVAAIVSVIAGGVIFIPAILELMKGI
jgi:diacylglycerol kinase (ATP)